MPSRPKLLIADDEGIIRKRLVMMLRDSFDLDEASTAAEARSKIANFYDAVLLDIVFPDGNGIELCGEFKKQDPYRTVIVSSSMETVDAWTDAFAAKADGYLEKRELLNLHPRKMILMIKHHIERNTLRKHTEIAKERQTTFLSVLSHDVRAPFQTLLGIIDMMKKGDLPSSVAGNVNRLEACAKDQLNFINALLELMRLDSGCTELRKRPIDLNMLVLQSVQSLGISAKHKEISIITDLNQEIPRFQGDIARILQLINNLLSNAVKFSPRGKSITVRSRLSAKRLQSGIALDIIDLGTGVAQADKDRIFQKFYRGKYRGTEGEKGSGLGLSICNEIMALHEGFLEYSDNPNGGSIFTAWFPVDAELGEEDGEHLTKCG